MNCARSWTKAQEKRTKAQTACVSGPPSRTVAARRRAKRRIAPALARPRCIAYFRATGARCGRLSSRSGWRAPLFLCAKHGQGFAALQAMVAGYSDCRRIALANWRFAWEIPL
jgi:hypothetical protein